MRENLHLPLLLPPLSLPLLSLRCFRISLALVVAVAPIFTPAPLLVVVFDKALLAYFSCFIIEADNVFIFVFVVAFYYWKSLLNFSTTLWVLKLPTVVLTLWWMHFRFFHFALAFFMLLKLKTIFWKNLLNSAVSIFSFFVFLSKKNKNNPLITGTFPWLQNTLLPIHTNIYMCICAHPCDCMHTRSSKHTSI